MGKKGTWFSAVKKAFSASKDSSDDHLQDPPAHYLSWKDGKQEIIVLQEKKSFKERNRWSFRRSSRALQPADQLHFQPGNDLGHLDQVPNGGMAPVAGNGSFSSGHTHFEKSYRHGEHPNKQALAVAVATAAAAEAAVAAAQAAAQVAKLTGTVRSGRNGNNTTPRSSNVTWRSREELAAIRIQTAFRAFLARRTLRTLKGLARLQALAQGRVGQRQTTATMRCMQALVRAQAAVRGRRTTRLFEDDTAGAATLLHPTSLERWEHRRSPAASGKDHNDESDEREPEWDHSTQTIEQIRARELSKQEAAVKRERSMAYAFSHQQLNMSNPYSSKASMTPQLGWNWLERWMAARPWENRRPSPAKEMTPRGITTPATPPIISSLPQRHPSPLRRGSAPATPGPPSFRQSTTPRTSSPARRAATVTPILSSFSAPATRPSVPVSASKRAHSLASSSLRDDLSVASFSGTPSYMASTESARAKLRSHSTPKQRPCAGTRSSTTSIHSDDMNLAQQPAARKRLSFTNANADTGSARSFLSWRSSSAPLQRNLSFEGRYTRTNF